MKTSVIKQGRPPTVKNAIIEFLPLFRTMNNREITEKLLRDRSFRAKLKGGMKGNREKQASSVFVTVAKLRNEKLAEGRRVEFKGRLGLNGKILKRKRLVSPDPLSCHLSI